MHIEVRILWMSNTPLAGTGYGVQTAEIVPRIKAAGHDIAIACNFGLGGAAIEWNGIPMFPSGHDQACNDVIGPYYNAFRADCAISLYDVWTMQREAWPPKVASWVPIDHQPAPPAVVKWCRDVTPIAMSRFGQRMLKEQGIESTYIPHSINTGIFKPSDRTRLRKGTGIPDDAFLVVIAAANQGNHPPRKAWGQMFQALAVFLNQHPDAWVYIHTNKYGQNRGLDLDLMSKQIQLPAERIRYTNHEAYLTGNVRPADLASIYSSGDVLLASSMGEGFGIPVIEAQACGLPVIVSDFTAQPELCESGWLVSGQLWWDDAPGQGHSWFFDPNVSSILKRLNEAYQAKGDKGLRERAVAFAAEYDSDKVFAERWVPFLETLARPSHKTGNRAERRRALKEQRKGKAA